MLTIDESRLDRLLKEHAPTEGWKRNHVLPIGDHQVFVKRISITDLELANAFSTRNFYQIPTYYNYGVGSAGFGVYRELAANVKSTNWVLSGECELFPMLYHWRVRRHNAPPQPFNVETHESLVKYWGANDNIATYRIDRAMATHELVLFLEYVPTILHSWLRTNISEVEAVTSQILKAISFMKSQGMIHFDVHFHNILIDDKQIYVTDFGLVLDRSFDLTPAELAFFDDHVDYDFGEGLAGIGYLIEHVYEQMSDTERAKVDASYGINPEMTVQQRLDILLDRGADGYLPIDSTTATAILKVGDITKLIRDFFHTLKANERKDTPFPKERLRQLLVTLGS